MVDFEEEYQQILELLRDYNGWVKRKLQTPACAEWHGRCPGWSSPRMEEYRRRKHTSRPQVPIRQLGAPQKNSWCTPQEQEKQECQRWSLMHPSRSAVYMLVGSKYFSGEENYGFS